MRCKSRHDTAVWKSRHGRLVETVDMAQQHGKGRHVTAVWKE